MKAQPKVRAAVSTSTQTQLESKKPEVLERPPNNLTCYRRTIDDYYQTVGGHYIKYKLNQKAKTKKCSILYTCLRKMHAAEISIPNVPLE